ncbi:MAG: hypothetical protein WCA00_12490 [Candidatus Acidiferrales bacterium]
MSWPPRKAVVEDKEVGNHAAIGCHLATYANFKGAIATWDAGTKTIRGLSQRALDVRGTAQKADFRNVELLAIEWGLGRLFSMRYSDF